MREAPVPSYFLTYYAWFYVRLKLPLMDSSLRSCVTSKRNPLFVSQCRHKMLSGLLDLGPKRICLTGREFVPLWRVTQKPSGLRDYYFLCSLGSLVHSTGTQTLCFRYLFCAGYCMPPCVMLHWCIIIRGVLSYPLEDCLFCLPSYVRDVRSARANLLGPNPSGAVTSDMDVGTKVA